MSAPEPKSLPDEPDYIRIKREPLYIWLARLLWLICLIILLEYAVQSHYEREPQAAISAGALCLVLFVAGVIVEVVRHAESQPTTHVLRTSDLNQDEDLFNE
jgi:Na+/H+ antiporter NhaD/arsenite permease-like protein